jgi:hypothetical protein
MARTLETLDYALCPNFQASVEADAAFSARKAAGAPHAELLPLAVDYYVELLAKLQWARRAAVDGPVLDGSIAAAEQALDRLLSGSARP